MAASSACLIGSGLSVYTIKQRSQKLGFDRASKVTVVKASLDENKHEGRRGFFKLLLGNAAAGVGLLASGNANADEQGQGVSSSRMSYSRFLEYLDKGRVEKVDLYENGTIAIVEAVSPELGNRIQRVRVQLPGLSQELLQKLRAKNIDFAAHNAQEDQGSPILNLIGNLAFPVILIGGLFLLSRRSSGGMGGPGGPGFPLQIGQSKAKFQMEPNTGVTFDDVAGVDEAKQDFMEVVEFLKKPERFTAVGARIPKGVLLVGPPGTGKTLLAKAIAGEAGVPFFSISGSEFVEMFVGVGASRVRDLFKKAKENAPCIVFVDEIDAVGRQRGTGIGGGNDEREQTLNQLLTEMDGFEGNTGVIVVAATNRADILDSALLRPGRFDRQVSVDVPDVKGRTDILKVHSGNKKFDNGVSLEVIAMRTPGFSGADLANLLNEAAILAGRRGKTAISSKEIDDSIDRIVAGMEGTVMTDGKSKSLVAYHEVGHAVCGTLTPGHDAVQKVTLIPRGQARGLTWFIPSDDPTLISKQQLFARIVGGLGGRAAEEVIFGEPEVTTGAVSDLQQITGLAKQKPTCICIIWFCLLVSLSHHGRASSSTSIFNLSLPHQHPFPEHVVLNVQRKLNDSLSRRQLLTYQQDDFTTSSSPIPSCITGNPIDDCWRCDPNWSANRQRLADCSIGFGQGTLGGKGGQFYLVTDSSDNDAANPIPGTLRHAVIQPEPLWIVFSSDMGITLKHELIIGSYKTIDGRGTNVQITGHGCLTIQQVSHVIIHNVHIHHCKPSGNTLVASSPTHVGYRGISDGDGISVSASHHIWVDHCSLGYCADGLIDVILASTAVTISNNYFYHHDEVMLLGHDDRYTADKGMQVTIAFNHFGEGLVQRMPRCRHGYIHVVNNDFTAWEMYAIGGSASPTINSQGNRYTAPIDPNAKEVTKRVDSNEKHWSGWNWRTEGDVMLNGAFFVPSGDGVSPAYARATSVQPKAAAIIDQLTVNAGVFGDPSGRNGQGGSFPGITDGGGTITRGYSKSGPSGSSGDSDDGLFTVIFGNNSGAVALRPGQVWSILLIIILFWYIPHHTR